MTIEAIERKDQFVFFPVEHYIGTVEREGQKLVSILAQYNQILEELEMLEDIRDFREAKAVDEESFPGEVIDRLILDKENPIKVFREYRGLTQEQLADKTGIQRTDLAAMETGKEPDSPKTLKAIAEVLDLDVDLISISQSEVPSWSVQSEFSTRIYPSLMIPPISQSSSSSWSMQSKPPIQIFILGDP